MRGNIYNSSLNLQRGWDILHVRLCRSARSQPTGTLKRTPSWDEPAIELETWAYDPAILGEHGVVDPLSLWASIPDGPDERLGQAKDALLDRIVP